MALNKPLVRSHSAPESDNSAAVERATVLLARGMQETDAPIADLGAALARMAATLDEPTADVATLRAVLTHNIAVCIESLQSYDRLMQQLAQARDILTGLARPANVPGEKPRREGTVELF